MADIYVRPYDSGGRGSNRGLLIAVLLAFVVGGGIWWGLSHRADKEEEPEKAVETVQKKEASKPAPKKKSKAPVAAQPDINRAFEKAQSLVSSGKLTEGSTMLEDVILTTADTNLKNSALRMQGRANIKLFLSDVPTPEKKAYVIQPGDSLDRIARRNHTTVELLQRINGIEGALIYPGRRLLVPAAPFILKVDKSDRTMDLTINGKRLKRYSVGLGRYGKTPLGTFTTVVHQTNPDWSPPSGGIVPYGDPENVLGTRWISIQDKSRLDIKGFGIHGTSDRESIGSETSNGCIRMLNEEVEEVFLLFLISIRVITWRLSLLPLLWWDLPLLVKKSFSLMFVFVLLNSLVTLLDMRLKILVMVSSLLLSSLKLSWTKEQLL